MKKPRMKDKMGLFLGLGILILCMLCAPACAAYNYNGYPVVTVEHGTVKGDVYVSYGDKAGFNNNNVTTYYTPHSLITNFSDVPTDGIVWAELKVGVWGAKTTREGFANAALSDGTNDSQLGMVYLNTTNPSSNVDCCGNGLYLIKYNCTDKFEDGTLNGPDITATINAWPDTSLASTYWLDSRIYGAVLIVAYEDGNCYTQYWINQGLENLHKDYTGYPHKDANITWFNGTAEEGCSSLTVGYLAGDYGQDDYLHFNPPYNNTSPYVSPYNSNFGNAAWNKTYYYNLGYQVGDDDVANENNNANDYFDLHTFCVTGRVNNTDNNYATFWRAQNSTGTIYDPAWPGVGDGESYYSPFLAVLKTKITTFDFSDDTSGVAGEDLFAYRYQNNSNEPVTNDVPDITFTSAQYDNIKADDGIFQQDETDADGNYAAHRFVFNVSCCSSSCNLSLLDANVTWDGKGYHDAGDTSNGADLYIWNFNTRDYEPLASCNDENEHTLTGDITANLNNYISNGQMIVLAEQKTAQNTVDETTVYKSYIETDYVKLLLKPK